MVKSQFFPFVKLSTVQRRKTLQNSNKTGKCNLKNNFKNLTSIENFLEYLKYFCPFICNSQSLQAVKEGKRNSVFLGWAADM